jgi:putative transcriptional regulator
MKLIYALLVVLLGTSSAISQELEAGSLLVATDELLDPHFAETVILLLHYGSDGALGVAINRPTWVIARNSFPDMPFLGGYKDSVYFGGPLAPANLVTLIRIPDNGEDNMQPIVDDIYVSADPDFLDRLIDATATDQTLRVYAGHAGWESGQLEVEIADGNWRVTPADAEIVFTTDPLALWAELRAPETELMVSRPDYGSGIAAR